MTEFVYFQDIGKGEAIRLALDLAGIEYKEKIIKLSEWPEKKVKCLENGTLPFGQLPLLRIDGMEIVQSTTILRYLSRKYISPNATDELVVLIDMMVEGWNEVITGYFDHLFNSPGVLKAWLYNECDTLLSHLEHYYLMKSHTFFVSEEPTVVDCIAVASIENIMYDMPEVLKNHKGLTQYMKHVLSCEAINKSLQRRHMLHICLTNNSICLDHFQLYRFITYKG